LVVLAPSAQIVAEGLVVSFPPVSSRVDAAFWLDEARKEGDCSREARFDGGIGHVSRVFLSR
jgi:hypothetical protein